MAEEALGKGVKQLKQERTIAKSAITKQANFLSWATGNMTRSELQEEFTLLTTHARNVSESNDDYQAGLLADIEAEEEGKEAKLGIQQQVDLEKTKKDCDARLKEVVRKIAQVNLWSRYWEDEVESAIQEAETACEGVGAIPVSAVNKDGYELWLDGAKKLLQDEIASLTVWKIWILEEEKASLNGKVKGPKMVNNNLEARRAEFLIAQRVAEGEKVERVPEEPAQVPQLGPQPVQQPVLKTKPTSLPKFHGFKRNFHHWKKDWKSLQRQGS